MKKSDLLNIEAEDITYLKFEAINDLVRKEDGLKELFKTYGQDGMNGGLFQGNKTKKLYKVCGRTTTLWQIG